MSPDTTYNAPAMNCARRARGFTLLEVLVVLGLILVLLTMVVGVRAALRQSMGVIGGEAVVSSAIANARILAMDRLTDRTKKLAVVFSQIDGADTYIDICESVGSSRLANGSFAGSSKLWQPVAGRTAQRMPDNITVRSPSLRASANAIGGSSTPTDTQVNTVNDRYEDLRKRTYFAIYFDGDGLLSTRPSDPVDVDRNVNGLIYLNKQTPTKQWMIEPSDLISVPASSFGAVVDSLKLEQAVAAFRFDNPSATPKQIADFEDRWVSNNARFVMINRYTGNIIKEPVTE